MLPVLSNFYQMIKVMNQTPQVDYAPFHPLVRDQFGENPPAFVGFMSFFKPLLIINKPGPLTDIFVNKNKIRR